MKTIKVSFNIEGAERVGSLEPTGKYLKLKLGESVKVVGKDKSCDAIVTHTYPLVIRLRAKEA